MDELPAVSPPPTLSLVVLESGDIEAAKDFYSLLGLSFVEERHGTGPRHYSATLGTLILEIYPRQERNAIAPVRIGFHVASIDKTLDLLRARGAPIIREAKNSPWGRRAVVEDPDGNRVELTSSSSESARGNPMIPIAKQERPIDMTEMVEQIQSHPDFVAFSHALLKDLKENPEGWENSDLAAFLEALGAWVEDMNGYYQAKDGAIPLQPSWKMLAHVLLAAKVYE